MEIRPIRAEDYEQHRHIISLAFARGKTPEFAPDVYQQSDRVRIGVYEGGRLQAALGILDFEFLFGEDRRACGGIFGVASDPAMRGRGFAGALVERSLEMMRERGQFLSSLWPFDFRYYRRYGWEWAGETRSMSIPLELIPSSRESDRVEGLYEDIVPVIEPVYLKYASQYNGMLFRSQQRWEEHIGPAGGRRRAVYIYRNQGAVEGYIILRYTDKEDELRANELVALTRRAYEGLLGVARRHAMTAKRLLFSAPINDMLPSILQHWDVETKLEPAGMGRVVDVKGALEAIRPGADVEGAITFGLQDEHAPWNAGAWRIVVEGGHVQVDRYPGEPGVRLDIQAMTQAYWGSPSLLDLRRWGRVEVVDEDSFRRLAAVLPATPAWLNDGF